MSRKKPLKIGDIVELDGVQYVLGDILRTEPTVRYKSVTKGLYREPEAVRTSAKILGYVLQNEDVTMTTDRRPDKVAELEQGELF